jgi:two-component system OmpR family response regulator
MTAILLVEDDPVLGRGLSVNLELEGYKVSWMRDLKSALQFKDENKFDLAILDLGLPDGSGLDFLKDLRKQDFQKPVLILTAKTDEDSVVVGLQDGANDYIRKPFGNKELLARIKTALRERRSAAARSAAALRRRRDSSRKTQSHVRRKGNRAQPPRVRPALQLYPARGLSGNA